MGVAEEARTAAIAQAATQESVAAAARREAALVTEQYRGASTRAEELAIEVCEARGQIRSLTAQVVLLQAQAEAAEEKREAVEEAAQLATSKAEAARFELQVANDTLADERSKLMLKATDLKGRDEHVAAVSEEVAGLKHKLSEREESAEELYKQLRNSAAAGVERQEALAEARDRVASLEVAVTAKDEQLELVRSRLQASADGGKANAGAAHSLAASAEAMAEELCTKEEQLALLRKSIGMMEEEMAARDSSAGAMSEKTALLQRECAKRDDEVMALSERLQAAQLEIKVGGSAFGRKNEELASELHATKSALIHAQQRLAQLEAETTTTKLQQALGGFGLGGNGLLAAESAQPLKGSVPAKAAKARTLADGASEMEGVGGWRAARFFHNTCLLVKVLLAAHGPVSNTPIDTLYEEVVAQKVPIEAWPQFVYERYSGKSIN